MNNTEQTPTLEQLQTIEGAKTFFKNSPEECKQNLIAAIQQNNKEEEQTNLIRIKEEILNKPNMTSVDKENIQKSITYLEKTKMDMQRNLKKLDAINYGSNYIEIGGVKFSREKLVPQVEFNKKPNTYHVFESDNGGIFKTLYNGKEEYYFTTNAYKDESTKQGKRAITDGDIIKALKALPDDSSGHSEYQGANILGNILDLSMSGYIVSNGAFWNNDESGYLSFVSRVHTNTTTMGTFQFNKVRGGIRDLYMRRYAFPCLFIVK